MKHRFLYLLTVILMGFLSSANASPISGANPSGKGGKFGLGFILGEPLGFSGKYFYVPTRAIEVNLGFGYSHLNGFQICVDHLWHPHVLTEAPEFKLSWFIGVGPYIIIADDRYDGRNRHLELGPRVPFGLSFNFKNVPIDAFVTLAPGANVVSNPGFRVDGGAGARFYF